MKRSTRRHLEMRAAVIKALAHATRLYLVERLSQGECCVCDLSEGLDVDISTVSRHLGILKAAGVVESERRGKQVHYRLRTPCILDFLGCVERVLTESADAARACRVTR